MPAKRNIMYSACVKAWIGVSTADQSATSSMLTDSVLVELALRKALLTKDFLGRAGESEVWLSVSPNGAEFVSCCRSMRLWDVYPTKVPGVAILCARGPCPDRDCTLCTFTFSIELHKLSDDGHSGHITYICSVTQCAIPLHVCGVSPCRCG